MSHQTAKWSEWGKVAYQESYRRQLELISLIQKGEIEDRIVTVEHPHVITVGRRKDSESNILARGDVEVVHVERGGDVTYHGPGQLIVYPLIRLEEHERDLHLFLRHLEEAMINALIKFGLNSTRNEGKTGIWIDGRKLASIGIACRKWVTFHGLALNVNTDLSYFSKINPCGFKSSIMTSMKEELGRELSMDEVKEELVSQLFKSLNRST